MFRRAPILACCLALLLAACGPKTNVPWVDPQETSQEASIQRELAVREFAERRARLERIATPLLLANAPLCGGRKEGFAGLTLMLKDAEPEEWQVAMGKVYGLDHKIRVTGLAPDGPAARAGVRRGDVFLGFNGTAYAQTKEGYRKLLRDLDDAEDQGPLVLALERDGQRLDLQVRPVPMCGFRVAYLQSDDVNAYADGERIVVTQGMIRFCEKDEELALVLGHELAHNSMGHITAKTGNALAGTVLDVVAALTLGVNTQGSFTEIGADIYSQEFEAEADYVGLYYTARAGFDISDAANFWRRMAMRRPAGIKVDEASTHPSTAQRYVGIEKTRAEIERKKALGQELAPEMRAPAPKAEAPKPAP